MGDLGTWPDIIGTGGENQNWEWQKTGIWAKIGKRGKFQTIRQFKRKQESKVSQLDSNNRFYVLTKMKVSTSDSERTKKKEVKVRKTKGDESLREIIVKIGLERIDI